MELQHFKCKILLKSDDFVFTPTIFTFFVQFFTIRATLENSLFLVGIGTKQRVGRSVNKNKNKIKNIFLFGTFEQKVGRLVTRNTCKRKSRHIFAEDLLKITHRIYV